MLWLCWKTVAAYALAYYETFTKTTLEHRDYKRHRNPTVKLYSSSLRNQTTLRREVTLCHI